jgi:hypothetical protein
MTTLRGYGILLELVDLVVNEVVHLGVEASRKALLGGELIDCWGEDC